MQIIKAIGFDFGGVLEGRPNYNFQERASEFLNVSKEEFNKAYFNHNRLYNTGQITSEDLWGKVLADLGKSEKLKDFLEYLENRPAKQVDVDVLAIVDALREQQYKVGVLSNNVAEARDIFIKKDIPRHFDAILISAEIGYAKPHTKAFELLFEELGCQPHEGVFIDDTEASLSSASEVGFHPILFENADRLREDLAKIGIILSI